MAKPIDAQTLAKARTQCPCVLDRLADTGMSDELIAVKMSDYLAGTNPSVQSLARWRKGSSIPNRANGAALVHLYEETFGPIEDDLWENTS